MLPVFQLTTSRRGRLQEVNAAVTRVAFQLTTSRRGRRKIALCQVPSLLFQLTTSRRGRPIEIGGDTTGLHFNSLPHAEVDLAAPFLPGSPSYHFNSLPHAEVDSSYPFIMFKLMLFQLTTSRRGRQLTAMDNSIAEAFQLTTSRRGRLILLTV